MRMDIDAQSKRSWYSRIIISSAVNGSITLQVQQNIKQLFNALQQNDVVLH